MNYISELALLPGVQHYITEVLSGSRAHVMPGHFKDIRLTGFNLPIAFSVTLHVTTAKIGNAIFALQFIIIVICCDEGRQTEWLSYMLW